MAMILATLYLKLLLRLFNADDVAEEEEAEKAKEIAPNPPKRQRKQNTMVGGVRKGNYSKN